MGTSKNVSSPDTPPWKPLLAILGRSDISPERQAQEIWRSAFAERGIRLLDEFGSPAVAIACGIAAGSTDLRDASRSFTNYLAAEHRAGFATEIAKRALVRAISTNAGAEGFARELFAEATSYYASRDLPSFVGARGRIETVSSSIELKNKLKDIARTAVGSAGQPPIEPGRWAHFTETVIKKLRGTV